MKKVYSKPMIYVEEFHINQRISTCKNPVSKPLPVKLVCLPKCSPNSEHYKSLGDKTIFTTEMGGCEYKANSIGDIQSVIKNQIDIPENQFGKPYDGLWNNSNQHRIGIAGLETETQFDSK